MHSWDPLLPCFSVSDKFSPIAVGSPPSYNLSSLWEDHVNNHVSLGVPPLNTDTRMPCQVEVTPHKSEGLEPFTLVNSPPGQVEVPSWHPINTLSGQVEDASSHMVNSLPCQVGVIPCSPRGIEPSTLVNSLPGKVRATPSHPINTLSGLREVTSLVSSRVPVGVFPSVSPVSPLTSSMSVLVPLTDRSLPVTSPLCPLPSDPSSTSLNTTQATSHKQPVDLPAGSGHPRSAFIEEVDDEDLLVPSTSPQPIGHATVQHIDNPDIFDGPGLTSSSVHHPSRTLMTTWAPLTLTMTLYLSLVTLSPNSLAK